MIDLLLEETSERLNNALEHAEETACVLIGEDILTRTPEVLRECFDSGSEKTSFVLIADRNTYKAAGNRVEAAIRSEGSLELEETFLFSEGEFHADAIQIEKVRNFLARCSAIPVAVGSGTINDIVKRAAFEVERPYMIVGTAASMDGYTSFGAAVDVDGFKQTLPCPAPRAVLFDLNVLADAPTEMTAAGYADLLAKIPAGADWILADFVGAEPIHSLGWSLAQDHLRDWLADPAGTAAHEKKSLCRLIEGLSMSGLAMQVARTSRTASGAEHLFSHLWDNQHHTCQGKIPSHGFKVGIGTMSTSALYDSVLKLETEDLRTARREYSTNPDGQTWDHVETMIREHFGDGSLGRQILEQSRQKFVDKNERIRRFDLYIEHWGELKKRLRRQLFSPDEVRNRVGLCGAPTEPEEIGIDRDRLCRSYALAQLIRCRYNVLDFAWESGLWNELVTPLFEPHGFWGKRSLTVKP